MILPGISQRISVLLPLSIVQYTKGMNRKRPLNPMDDIFVKYLLGTEENKDLLISFINAVLDEKGYDLVLDVEIKNPFNPAKIIESKFSVLDIKAKDTKGRMINIEVQVSSDPYFASRSLYYWAKIYSDQLESGDQYRELNQTICINLLSFNLFETQDSFHSCFQITEVGKPENILTEDLQIHFIEIEKLKSHLEKHEPRDTLEGWCYYFLNEGLIEEDKMPVLLKKDKIFNKAGSIYRNFTADEEKMELIEAREKWLKDYNSKIESVRQEGRQEGQQEGRQQGHMEDARNLKQLGVDLAIISKATGLALDVIEKL